jgi:hypothetical protein
MLQTEGCPAQANPGSSPQVVLHPSLGRVLPSSQLSPPPIWPSPQRTQTLGAELQLHPGSMAQLAPQPSLGS